jgi:transcriptional regulator NrdR family protein
MTSITLRINDKFRNTLDSLPWVNWSVIAREEIQQKINEEKKLNALKKLIAKSEFTEEDADELAERVKQSMHKKLKDDGLI